MSAGPESKQCACGRVVFWRGMAAHLRGLPHECEMTQIEAESKLHSFNLHPISDGVVEALITCGYAAEFTRVKRHIPGFKGKCARVIHTWHTTARNQRLVSFMRSADDRPAATMHAALVFAEVYGDDAASVLLGMYMRETAAGLYANQAVHGESDLVAVLTANGVASPSLALINLASHALAAAVILAKRKEGTP